MLFAMVDFWGQQLLWQGTPQSYSLSKGESALFSSFTSPFNLTEWKESIKCQIDQSVTNTIFRPIYEYKFIQVNFFFGKYKNKYIWVEMFWQIQIKIYSDPIFFDQHIYILVYPKWASMSTKTFIWTDICKYK